MKFIQAKHFTPASRLAIDLIVIHTAECGESSNAAENLQSWTAGPTASQASWHYAVDNDSITQSVREQDVAWHAGPVNDYSIGIEHAGYAAQTPEQWQDTYSVAMLERSAELVASLCQQYGIPIVRLTAEDLKTRSNRGICGHVDVTNGLQGGKGHHDPGPSFPWDWYLARVRAYARAPAPAPAPAPSPVLATVQDVQRALTELGFHPGLADGVAGPLTRAATRAFQTTAQLTTDGIVGPLTRAALERALVVLRAGFP